jgi:hypothetical protein
MEESEELESGVKGKQGELRVIGMLLERGFSVYTPVVDTGLDCIIDSGNGNYKEVQIKSRTKIPLFQVKKTTPRDSLFIICYLVSPPELWVVPSRVFFERGTSVKGRTGKHYVRVVIGKEGSSNYEAFRQYRDNFHLLTGATTRQHIGRHAVEQYHAPLTGKHLKQRDLEAEILHVLSGQSSPLSTKQIIQTIRDRLANTFSETDLAKISAGRTRWEATTRFAIYQGLKRKKMIQSKGKNQWVITQSGLEHLKG